MSTVQAILGPLYVSEDQTPEALSHKDWPIQFIRD